MQRLKCFCCFNSGIDVITTRSLLALNCGFMMITLDPQIDELVCVIGKERSAPRHCM